MAATGMQEFVRLAEEWGKACASYNSDLSNSIGLKIKALRSKLPDGWPQEMVVLMKDSEDPWVRMFAAMAVDDYFPDETTKVLTSLSATDSLWGLWARLELGARAQNAGKAL